MDFGFTPEEQALRREAREFVQRNWDPGPFDPYSLNVFSYDYVSPEARDREKEFIKKVIGKGWYTAHWPEEYGGKNASVSTQVALREVMAYWDAPDPLGGGLVAHALMLHGTEYQKRTFLPRIGNNDIQFAQGFSEPNAGTDLASLQTRAVLEGDDFVVTGQKIWSSASHFADWYHVLVRTDPDAPKHRGITYLLMQLRDENGNYMPGVTLRPLYDMVGHRRWNEVFLDGARVPKRLVIGEVNRGWYAAMSTLNFERTWVDAPTRLLGALDRFIDLCRDLRFNGLPVLANLVVRHRLADLRLQIEVDRLLAYVVAWAQGETPVREGAISNYRNEAFSKLVFWPTLAHIVGEYSALQRGEERAPHRGMYGANYALSMTRGFGGGGGILLSPNLIAQRGLGLPR